MKYERSLNQGTQILERSLIFQMKQAYVSHIHSQLHLRGCALHALHIDCMKCTEYTVCCKSALVYHVSVLISSAWGEKHKVTK